MRGVKAAPGGPAVVGGAHSGRCSEGVAAGCGRLLRTRCGHRRTAAGWGAMATCDCEATGPIASPPSSPIWRRPASGLGPGALHMTRSCLRPPCWCRLKRFC